jgi:hypothetical protein
MGAFFEWSYLSVNYKKLAPIHPTGLWIVCNGIDLKPNIPCAVSFLLYIVAHDSKLDTYEREYLKRLKESDLLEKKPKLKAFVNTNKPFSNTPCTLKHYEIIDIY